MVEAVTVFYTASRRALSPLFHGFEYLSSLTSGFCGEFSANSMIPQMGGGRGIPHFPALIRRFRSSLAVAAELYFAVSSPLIFGQQRYPRGDGQILRHPAQEHRPDCSIQKMTVDAGIIGVFADGFPTAVVQIVGESDGGGFG